MNLNERYSLKISLYCNHSECYLNLKNHCNAITDCSNPLKIDPNSEISYQLSLSYKKNCGIKKNFDIE